MNYYNIYKDVPPDVTVTNIKRILGSLNLEVDEIWVPENELGTFSLRLELKGTGLGTNGKGMTRDYAAASAYAEFMERFQNNVLGNTMMQAIYLNSDNKYFSTPDEINFTAEEIIKENSSFIQHLFKI